MPSPLDTAIALARECRYTGNGLRWYPVLLHTFVVADLSQKRLKFDALNHDDPECITGDMPAPYKTTAFKRMEHRLHQAFYKSWNIPFPDKQTLRAIKTADNDALYGEVYTVGAVGLRKKYPQRSADAERLTMMYSEKYPPSELLTPSGLAVVEWVRRWHEYKDMR
jgi:hypothetical protein